QANQTLTEEKNNAIAARDARPDTPLKLEEIQALQARADITLINDSINIQSLIDKFNNDLGLGINFDSGDKIIDKLEKIFKKVEELLKNPDNNNEELENKLKEAERKISDLQKQLIGKEDLEKIIEIDLNALNEFLPEKIEDKKEKEFREVSSYQQLSTNRQGLIKNYVENNFQKYSKENNKLVNQKVTLSFFLATSLLVIGALIYKIKFQKKSVLEKLHNQENKKKNKKKID
ncbi:MAG: hypothetical protein LBR43_00210, partial [Spiroplasmataceae bacterium]|nr:hypothetical protein [Spiroplasmataceae bacterium]